MKYTTFCMIVIKETYERIESRVDTFPKKFYK